MVEIGELGPEPGNAMFSAGRIDSSEQGEAEVAGGGSGKIYLSACSAVQREFGGNRAIRPQVTVVLGADKDEVQFGLREIRLTKWDRHLFAEGMAMVAFEDLALVEQRLTLAKRAVNWADATVEIDRIEK